jgi:hypothetical protein
MTLSLEHICSKFIAMIDNKLNNNASKFRLRMKNKSVRIHIPQVQNNGKVVPRTFQPTGFLLRHTFNCSHHRRRMSCHFAPISQERNFTSVLFFFCHATRTITSKLTCLARVFPFCGAKPNTSLATVAAASAVRPGSTCQLAAGSCEARLFRENDGSGHFVHSSMH